MVQTIINMANAMYSNHHKTMREPDDRLDAARALLGVSPNSVADSSGALALFGAIAETETKVPSEHRSKDAQESKASANDNSGEDAPKQRPRSNSAGLDALALLASKEQVTMGTSSTRSSDSVPVASRKTTWDTTSTGLYNDKPLIPSALSSSSSCSSEDDYDMPPPAPRRGSTRPRSVSNPEGMDRWKPPSQHDRLRFVLPATILEQELAEASAAMKAKGHLSGEQEDSEHDCKEEEVLDQGELLRRARSRLLEDLSEVNLNGEKGVLVLPHALDKYKEVSETKTSLQGVYNKNGRVGIYTQAERSAIIARFLDKRSRRVWNKKIRYNCRKSLADRRMRVKGRFVKRATEEEAKLASRRSPVPPIPEDGKFESPESDEFGDSEMPDISDPDAGFCPTDDQPFRRLRRHTIT
eukprot:Nitzschia sp. Nitz4//scaffold161_size51353//28965//30262//NITZ4_006950-RA/size51353-augustus-gene-0.46-mRNA-1//1//CDS//3329537915//8847//frame0